MKKKVYKIFCVDYEQHYNSVTYVDRTRLGVYNSLEAARAACENHYRTEFEKLTGQPAQIYGSGFIKATSRFVLSYETINGACLRDRGVEICYSIHPKTMIVKYKRRLK